MKLGVDTKERNLHPVDVIEQIVHHRDWSFERTMEDEISLLISGQLSYFFFLG